MIILRYRSHELNVCPRYIFAVAHLAAVTAAVVPPSVVKESPLVSAISIAYLSA